MSNSPIPEVCDFTRSILFDVTFSKEAYYPGSVMTCMLTLKKPATAQNDIYFEWLAVQIHGHVAIDPQYAVLPIENRMSNKVPMSTLPNIKSLQSDDCMCLYQSSPFVLESDYKLGDAVKKYIVQIRIPENIPPSLKCSSVKYFHLFSVIISFPNSSQRSYITEFKVHLPPSYTQPESFYEYSVSYPPIKTCKIMDVSDMDLSLRVSSDSLSMNDNNQLDEDDDIFINNDVRIYNRNLEFSKDAGSHNSDLLGTNKLSGTYGITCREKSIGKIKISTNEVRLGESIFINIDLSETELKCLRVMVALRLSQYLPSENYKLLKEKTVTHTSVTTLSTERIPLYISVPSFSPPSITTQQIQLRWSLFFVFTVQHQYVSTPTAEASFTFEPNKLDSSSIENIEWSFPIKVFAPQPSNRIEQFGDIPMFLGDESIFTLAPLKPSLV